ncbi:MAG: hypothetical protein C5B49_03650 [Bdellovibrio sp.]|nr:MAG: hypothetical protein C5B49_03650 [Bdellovibrio sp.]
MPRLTLSVFALAVSAASLGGFELIPDILANSLFLAFSSVGIVCFALTLLFSAEPFDEPPPFESFQNRSHTLRDPQKRLRRPLS